MTDANLLLGRLPSTLPEGSRSTSRPRSGRWEAIDPAGVIDVVDAEMVRALRVVSVEQGLDPRDFALVAFGGAGPLHACALADELGMATVLVPAAAGVLSASASSPPTSAETPCAHTSAPLADAGELPARGRGGPSLRRPVVRAARARSATVCRALPRGARGAVRLCGPRPRDRARRGANGRDRAAPPLTVDRAAARRREARRCSSSTARPHGSRTVGRARPTRTERWFSGGRRDRYRAAGDRRVAARDRGGDGRRAHPLGVLGEHQGAARLLDRPVRRAREMVTQAEHIPVHLGAMPEAVAAVMAHDPAPGEPWILNDPYAGGTHLPDLTIVTRTELGYAVTRAHHADVGGSEPGSLPPGSRTLDEEGVIIPPTRLDEATLESLVSRCGTPTSVAATFARSWPGTGSPRGASPSSARGAAATASRLRWTSSSPTRSVSSARRSASCRTAASRARTCSRRRDGPARRSAPP